jgi:hypothetical protein
LIPIEHVERLIHLVRGEKVLLDADLAMLYGVTTGNLNKAVKRNQQRFPPDFMFQLSDEETAALIFQSGRSNDRGGRRHNPYAFTEQGMAMLSSVLRSERAVQVNVAIMRAFVSLRRMLASNENYGHIATQCASFEVAVFGSAKWKEYRLSARKGPKQISPGQSGTALAV